MTIHYRRAIDKQVDIYEFVVKFVTGSSSIPAFKICFTRFGTCYYLFSVHAIAVARRIKFKLEHLLVSSNKITIRVNKPFLALTSGQPPWYHDRHTIPLCLGQTIPTYPPLFKDVIFNVERALGSGSLRVPWPDDLQLSTIFLNPIRKSAVPFPSDIKINHDTCKWELEVGSELNSFSFRIGLMGGAADCAHIISSYLHEHLYQCFEDERHHVFHDECLEFLLGIDLRVRLLLLFHRPKNPKTTADCNKEKREECEEKCHLLESDVSGMAEGFS